MRQIPMKNYVIAIIISVITVGLVFYLMNLYNNRDNKIKYINEVTETDLDYYIAENNDTFIYMTTNKNNKKLNKEFKKYLKNKELNIIYVDLNNVSGHLKKDFINKYYPKHYSSTFVITDSSFVVIEDSKIAAGVSKVTDFKQVKDVIERSNVK